MKAELHLKIQGIRGSNYKWREAGDVSIFPNGNYRQNGLVPFINVDAFEGRGETYKRREGNCRIEINDGIKGLFGGSFEELAAHISRSHAARFFADWTAKNCFFSFNDKNDNSTWIIMSSDTKISNNGIRMDSDQLFEWYFNNVWKGHQ